MFHLNLKLVYFNLLYKLFCLLFLYRRRLFCKQILHLQLSLNITCKKIDVLRKENVIEKINALLKCAFRVAKKSESLDEKSSVRDGNLILSIIQLKLFQCLISFDILQKVYRKVFFICLQYIEKSRFQKCQMLKHFQFDRKIAKPIFVQTKSSKETF